MTSKRIIVAATLVLSLGMSHRASAVSQEEIITLTKLGISPPEVIKAIQKDKTVFNLSVADILQLKKNRVNDKVIKFMLGTPQRFGTGSRAKPGGTSATPQQPAAVEEAPVREETPDEKRAREEQMRQEALKLLEERKRAEQAQREKFAKGVLAKGRALADQGRFVDSIRAFEQFREQGNYPPDSEEAYLANFGIADALVKAGLHQAAARQLVEVLIAGPDRLFFQTAFEQLRDLRSKVNYAPPALEQLNRFFVGNYSQAFQDAYNYVLGEFYYDYNNWTKALSYLEQVTPSARDYAKAQYLKGLVEVRNEFYKSAVASFQRAIVATEENESEPEIRDLGYLALARIAYESGNHDAAIYYYRKIPKSSYKRATAFYESAWVYFVKGDASRALGTFQTLHSPHYAHQFYPELWILESTVYMNMCRFDDAEEALTQYNEKIAPLAAPLKNFLLKTIRPKQYYEALVDTVSGKSVHFLPKALVAPVLADIEFYNLYRTIHQIESELELLEPHLKELGAFGDHVKQELSTLRSNRIREIGIKTQRILKSVESTLADYDLKVKEIEVDILDEKLQEEERELVALEGNVPARIKRAETGGTSAIVGSDSWQWPYEGEYWSDEIGTYRAFVTDRCVREVQE